MSLFAHKLLPSECSQLGAHWDGSGTHFSVFAENAERVELCIFDQSGQRQVARFAMPDCVHGVWRGYLPDTHPGTQYGYRAYGPYEPKHGHRFNPHKLLLDPYARQVAGFLKWNDALFGYHVGSKREDLSFDRRDSAPFMPKAVVANNWFDWGDDKPPRVPWSDLVIYEVHVKGFSKLREDILPHDRGTFGALGHPTMIDYLRRLGVTAVELLPVHLFARDRRLLEKGLTNYWGYNSLGFFCPDPAYLSDGTLGQVKWAIKQLHAAGIEVILDVVYNHTCEGNQLGPTLSWRGFGNASYYRLLPDNPRYHINDTGCGNTFNMSHPRAVQMVMDSLRYWVQEFHVDGFRFDLCATLGREDYGYDKGCGFFDALIQDPTLAHTKLISEPWDIGPGGHQVGNHPARFAEWNDQFRDDVRRFWRGDENLRGALAARLQGSAEIFDHDHRRPWASINFVTAHDGYNLDDLVSYEQKHNEANAEDNNDGSNNNISCNWGAEGATEDEAIINLREEIKRSFFTTLFCSHGTPMFLAGDEFGHSQRGNNNPYCQDNEITWLDWKKLETPNGAKLFEFVSELIALRRAEPLLQPHYFQHADIEIAPGVPDIFWFDEDGRELVGEEWREGNGRHLALQRAQLGDDGQVSLFVMLFNADDEAHHYQLPLPSLEYLVRVDTSFTHPKQTVVKESGIHIGPHNALMLNAKVHIDELNHLVGQLTPKADARQDTGRASFGTGAGAFPQDGDPAAVHETLDEHDAGKEEGEAHDQQDAAPAGAVDESELQKEKAMEKEKTKRKQQETEAHKQNGSEDLKPERDTSSSKEEEPV